MITKRSNKYVSMLCKKEMGYSPKHYQILKRIEKAEVLLNITNNSISEIASETGFYDQFYFSKVFNEYKGVSPIKYRNSYIQKI